MAIHRDQSSSAVVRNEERQRRRRARTVMAGVTALGVVVAAGAAVVHHKLGVKPARAKQALFEVNAILVTKAFAATASDPLTTICTTSLGLVRTVQAMGRPADILVVAKDCTMEDAAVAYKVTFDRADEPDRTIIVYQHEGTIAPGRTWPRSFGLKKPVLAPIAN